MKPFAPFGIKPQPPLPITTTSAHNSHAHNTQVRMAASCFAAGNATEAAKHKEKAQKMAKYVELLQKVARRRNLQVSCRGCQACVRGAK